MTNTDTIIDRMQAYGVSYSGEVVTAEYHSQVEATRMSLKEIEQAGGKITRVRLLREMGRYDISYIHATLADGRMVQVNLGWCPSTSLIPVHQIKGTFIEWAKAEGVFAKGLGLLDQSNWAVLG